VANKYLEPPLVVRITDNYKQLAKEGRLQATASLCLTLTDELLERTLDNKQDILQGHVTVPITPEGLGTFNKLKIMEVSSKHHHQAFSIQIQLQEIRTVEPRFPIMMTIHSIGEPVKSSPLHVQSRINKRKRSFLGHHGRPRKRSRGESDCNYVDITSLLVLPQKEAATRLGISESMLCKRFKECTRRKWPYRYLRKIDKMVRVLTLNKKADSIPLEDQEKIQRLHREREECLQPVKIRITGHDQATMRRLISSQNMDISSDCSSIGNGKNANISESDSETNDSNSGQSSNSSPYYDDDCEDDFDDDDDEISQVASTLNLLKEGAY